MTTTDPSPVTDSTDLGRWADLAEAADEPVADEAALPGRLGVVHLPANPGTGVGTFDFIVTADGGEVVEVGTPVAADTREGTFVGVVTDMRTVGSDRDPVHVDIVSGGDWGPSERMGGTDDVVVATVQVFASPRMRPIRSGTVRAAGAAELAEASGMNRMDWPIPAGVVPLADGSYAPVAMDGHSLLGPESAHLIVSGLSGMAAKTSYAGVLMRSALAVSDEEESTGMLLFNVKGDDLCYLDQPPAEGYELDGDDHAMYEALGIPATPFEDVTVYAPTLPGGASASPREDALGLRWDLPTVWPYLRHLLGPVVYEDEKIASFLADFASHKLYTDNPAGRVSTFSELEAWFAAVLAEAEESEQIYAWRSHHKATMWRLRRMLCSIPERCGGLVTKGSSTPAEDIPVEGWRNGQVVVVDIAGLNPQVQALVIARTIERLLKSAEEAGTYTGGAGLGVDHLILFADELNAFCPAQGSEMATVRKALEKVATQGRYAGISLWGAAQQSSRISELVRSNAASRAAGITVESELTSGVFGRLPGGLVERLATLPKGQMALWHYTFRGALVVKFPRPAWRTGKAKTKAAQGRRKGIGDSLRVSSGSLARLAEGVPQHRVEEIIAGADDPELARQRLERARVPDVRKSQLHEPSTFDVDDPFDLD